MDKKNIRLSPGNFIKFNYILKENDISINGDFLESLSILLNLYKKNKDIIFINIIYFIAEFYLKNLKDKKILHNERLFEVYDFILENVNKFVIYNMSQNSLINLISINCIMSKNFYITTPIYYPSGKPTWDMLIQA